MRLVSYLLESLWNRYGIRIQCQESQWNHFAIILETLCNTYAIAMDPLSNPYEILDLTRDPYVILVELAWNPCGGHLEPCGISMECVWNCYEILVEYRWNAYEMIYGIPTESL